MLSLRAARFSLLLFLLLLLMPASLAAQDAAPTIAVDANGSLTIELSSPTDATLDKNGFGLSCETAGSVSFSVMGSGSRYELTPTEPLPAGDRCTVSVFANGESGEEFLVGISLSFSLAESSVETTLAASACAGNFTAIGAVQGSAATAERGDYTIRGVVTGDFEDDGLESTADLWGFYVQDAGDGDAATSDAIFVFTNVTTSYVDVGDLVQMTGTVSEFPIGANSETQLKVTDPAAITVCSSDNPLPEPTPITMPFASFAEREQYEGMLVTFPQELTVTELFQLGRHGELVLSSGGRLWQPTNDLPPGDEANALAERNLLNQIILDDAWLTQNPDPIIFPAPQLDAENTVRGGQTISGLTGIFTQSRARIANDGNATTAYRLRVTAPVVFDTAANPRPTSAPNVGNASLTVGSFNLLNYFDTFTNDPVGCFLGGDSAPDLCRGAENADEFERQRAKTIAAVAALNADILGIVELENDDGDDQAIMDLVSGVNELLGAETYTFIDTGRIGGDAIRVGFLYKPDTVTPVGNFAVLDGVAPFTVNTRPPLAQLWQENASGEQFYAIVNHFKSKSTSGCPGTGVNANNRDGQGCWNGDRVQAAVELMEWIETDDYFDADADVLVVGDLNAYAQENPIQMLAAGGYTNLVAQFIGEDAYSYAFSAQWGYLDYALANAALLAQVTGVGEFHINADEPSVLDYNTNFKSESQIDLLYAPDFYRTGDHDPLLVGLALVE